MKIRFIILPFALLLASILSGCDNGGKPNYHFADEGYRKDIRVYGKNNELIGRWNTTNHVDFWPSYRCVEFYNDRGQYIRAVGDLIVMEPMNENIKIEATNQTH
jgi:hypothetical protein